MARMIRAHPVPVCLRHRKGRKDQQEDKDVVDAERPLDHVSGGPEEAVLAAAEEEHAEVKECGERDPDPAPYKRLFALHDMSVFVEHAEVEREENEDEGEKSRPRQQVHEIHWQSNPFPVLKATERANAGAAQCGAAPVAM
jgi:hypothetical protein